MSTTTTNLATSFITFTRTSNATVTDSNGFIKWAGHNLLTNSESFDASAWGKYQIVATANAIAAPNSTTTADTLTVSLGTGAVFQNTTVPIGTSTFSVFAKAGTVSALKLVIDDGASAGREATFTLSGSGTAGAVGNASGGAGTVSGGTSAITPLADSWYLCTLANVTTTATRNAAISIASNGTIYLWGAHLYRSDLGGMVANPARGDAYYPTTPRNLLGYTEAFDNAAWVKYNSSITANTIVAPNGLQTADKIVEDTASNLHGVYNTLGLTSVSGTPYVYSVYAKAAERSFVIIDAFTNASAFTWFNLSNGTVGTNASGSTASIESVGNGWYRCTVIRSSTSAASGTQFLGVYAASADNVFSYTGDGTSGIYLWGAQLSDSASLDAYSPVYDAAVTSAAYYAPRLDYSGSSLAALGLLVEEQRTNLVLNSAALNDASWSLTNATISADVAGATAVAPDGTNTADKLAEDNNTGIHRVFPLNAITVVSGSTYTYSIYAKAVERTRIQLVDNDIQGAIFDLSNGTVSSPGTGVTALPPVAVGNGWYRCSMTRNAGSTAGRLTVYLVDGTGSTSYAGVTGNGVLLWGAQLELGSFATSYIPTGASTATRTADVASVSTQAFPYSATEGTLVANVSLLSVNTAGFKSLATISDGTANNRIALYQAASATSAWQIVSSGGALQANITPGNVSANTPFKLGTAVASNDAAAYLGGVAGTPDTTVTMPAAATIMYIGGNASGGEPLNGWVRQITYLPRRLPNADLAARTV